MINFSVSIDSLFSSTQTSMKKKEKKADSRFVTHKALIHHAHIFTQLNTKLWWWREEIFLFSTRAPLKGKNFFLLRTFVSIPSFILFGMRVRKWSLAKRCIFLAITELQFYGLLTTIQHVKRTWGNWKPINASSSCSKIRVSSNREQPSMYYLGGSICKFFNSLSLSLLIFLVLVLHYFDQKCDSVISFFQ